uniref:DNA uptake/competence protein n=1 Tax=uncultured beta proteobacterium TaxID=86027 RepID=H5SF05_9PROT|nr:DNA uptake/competence protein [uncultured beta proteobacterium]
MPIVALAVGFLVGAVAWHQTSAFPAKSLTWGACALGFVLVVGALRRGRLDPDDATGDGNSSTVPARWLVLWVGAALAAWGSTAERSRPFFDVAPPESWFTSETLPVTLTVLERIPLAGEPPRAVVAALSDGRNTHRVRLTLPDRGAQGNWLPGERYHATVRLRPIRANVQPGAFDSEWWAFRHRLQAWGTIVSATPLEDDPGWVDAFARLRIHLAERLEELPPRHGAWLRALALGDRSSFDDTTWQLVQRTGTAHLVAISGMHVTLVAWLLGGIVARLWQRAYCATLWIAAPRVGWLVAIAVAWGYALLAGLGIPAVRAALMLTLAGFAMLHAQRLPASGVLAATLLAVLVWDPWAVGDAGFWLSFAAVALLFLLGRAEAPWRMGDAPSAASRSFGQRLWTAFRSFVTVQLALTLALAPLTLLFFGQAALLGAVANFVAIPLIAYAATPLALLLLIVPAPLLGQGFAGVIDRTLDLLTWASHLPAAVRTAPEIPAGLWWVAASLLLLALFLPRGIAPRLLALPALLLLFVPNPQRPEVGAAQITVLDVGQGQAILITTAHYALLYDAGPASNRWDSGRMLVLPFLQRSGIERLDAVVLSHFDRDHTGGFAAVAQALPIATVWYGAPPGTPPPDDVAPLRNTLSARPCRRGTEWEWDGVRFAFLWPTDAPHQKAMSDNAASCVLRVTSRAGTRFLVSGDLGVREEQTLVAMESQFGSDIVVIGHHGSHTSSSPAWVGTLTPRYALVSVGAFNPFGHPRCDVLERWRTQGATILRTDRDGALTLTLPANGNTIAVDTARGKNGRYWHRPFPAFAECGEHRTR